jgi:hypothetical protein
MKRTALALLLTGATSTAGPVTAAESFDTRIARASAAIETRDGYAYDMALVPAIHSATTKCVPPGRAPASRAESFTAVASVDPSGRVSAVQVRPVTALSKCFADRLGTLRLQPPPAGSGKNGYPILIRIRDTF